MAKEGLEQGERNMVQCAQYCERWHGIVPTHAVSDQLFLLISFSWGEKRAGYVTRQGGGCRLMWPDFCEGFGDVACKKKNPLIVSGGLEHHFLVS